MKKTRRLSSFFQLAISLSVAGTALGQTNLLLPRCATDNPQHFDCSFERWNSDVDTADWGEVSNVSRSLDFQDNPLLPQDGQALRLDVTTNPDPYVATRPGFVFLAAKDFGVGGGTPEAPRALRFYYKFVPQGEASISASARVVVVKAGGIFEEKGTGSSFTSEPSTAGFTSFDVPIEYTVAFDTTAFHLVELEISVDGSSESAIGTYAIIDNVSMVAFSTIATASSWWLEASSRAQIWSPNASLLAVQAGENGLSRTGASEEWIYDYFSSSIGKNGVAGALSIHVRDGNVVEAVEIDPATLPSTDPLPEGWVDSDAAASIAEMHSGNYRENNLDATVSARITLGLASDPSIPVWEFVYRSSADSLVVLVDAISGDVVGTAIDHAVPDTPQLPLLDAYPNPFEGSVTIDYDTTDPTSRVEIFDMLGRRVRVLPIRAYSPGRQSVAWDGATDGGRSAGNGVYAVRLLARDRVVSRMIVRIR